MAKKLVTTEKEVDTILTEIAEARKELEITQGMIASRERERNILALGVKTDEETVKNYNRLGEEIKVLREKLELLHHRLSILPGRIRELEQQRNAALAATLDAQAAELNRRFEEVKAGTAKNIYSILSRDHKELGELQTEIRKLSDKRQELMGPGSQRLPVPQLTYPAVEYACQTARGIVNGSIKVE